MNTYSCRPTTIGIQPWIGLTLITLGYFAVIDFAWVVISVSSGAPI